MLFVRSFFYLTIFFIVISLNATQAYAAVGFNTRFDGPDATSTVDGTLVADLNSDGYDDLLIVNSSADTNGKTNNGSVYVIFGSKLSQLTTPSTVLDLANTSNWNLRIDGALDNQRLGVRNSIGAGDLDNDSQPDLILGARNTGYNSRANAGSAWVIPSSIVNSYTSTGNVIDLSTSTNYWLRFDGAVAGCFLSDGAIQTGDLTNDGKNDLALGSRGCNRMYLIYNELLSAYTGTGNTIDLATSTNYNMLYSPNVNSQLSKDALHLADLNHDNKLDIVVGAQVLLLNGRTNSGAVYIIYNDLIDDYTGTGNSIDLSNSSNFNLRLEGAAASQNFGIQLSTADLNRNNKVDLLVGAYADYNSRTDSGSLFVFYDNLLDQYTGTGNTLDIATTSNFNLRYDGDLTNTYISAGTMVRTITGDYDHDGYPDLLLGSSSTYDGMSAAGVAYIIYNKKIISYGTSTGNVIDIANPETYDVSIGGDATGDNLTVFGSQGFVDLNHDGAIDLVLVAQGTDYNSRTNSGSVYIIYGTPTATQPSTTSSPVHATSTNCEATQPVGTIDLFQVNRLKTTAQLFFTPINQNVTAYSVIYGYTINDERFGKISAHESEKLTEGVQTVTINDLDPKKKYWFKVVAVNNCAVGNWSNWFEAGKIGNKQSIFYK